MSKAFEAWFDRFNQEKGIDPEQIIEVEGPSGANIMPLSVVLDAIKSTSDEEQKGIKAMIVKIDFANADVIGYYKHLAQAIAK